LVAGGSVATETAERVYRDLQDLPVDFHLSTGVLGVAASRVAVQRFDDVPVLGLRRVELTRWQQVLKRAFDLVVTSLLVVLLSPVMVACALAVRLSGPGPILFRQRRFGQDGTVFHVHKFRSMVADAEDRLPALRAIGNEADGPLFKLHHDPRVTWVGRILRGWSLDELPQLLDVLAGQMSLVGPRPLVTHEIDLTDPWARTRLRVKPGVTGLWQVAGRHRLPFDDLVRYDLFYVENWSLSMDLFVLLRTIPAVLRRSGV
jgi:exopolysaccharide biosynthesis polyprenyl glycosylphosphotransferase